VSNWKALAEQAKANGYLPGNQLEHSLKRHLTNVLPQLVAELEKTNDLQAYLEVKVSEAFDRMEKMEDQGTDPQTARELALADLYPTAPEDQRQPEDWEKEGAQEAVSDAVQQALLGQKPQRHQDLPPKS
jgi:hypothetical protein